MRLQGFKSEVFRVGGFQGLGFRGVDVWGRKCTVLGLRG